MGDSIQVYAECYANLWFARKLEENLKNLEAFEIHHKPTMGRDKILKKLSRVKGLAIGVIDYEEGQARNFLDAQSSEYRRIDEKLSIRVGSQKLKGKLLVVFDPKFEDHPVIKENLPGDFRSWIKSKEALSKLLILQKAESFERILNIAANHLSEVLIRLKEGK